MAVTTIRTDDLTGEPNASSVVIAVNDRGVQLDLSEDSIKKLTLLLAPYWEAGRESSYDVVPAMQRRSRDRQTRQANREYDLVELRAWADRNNIELPKRGRIPQAIIDRYLRG